MPEPLVTVIMPVYNAGPYLRQAVLSIVRQTFGDWELLIIDDGSTDDAIMGITDIADHRIHVVRNPRNLGLAATLNIGIDLARGEFIARMDQDDVAYPERLERQVALLSSDPFIDLVAVRCLAISPTGEAIGLLPWAQTHEALAARPWLGFYLPHPTWMARTAWYHRHRYATPAPYLCEDQELLLRSYHSSRFATIPEILFAYRVRSRIDWWRAFRTRKAILVIQIRYCLGQRQWHRVLLAAAVFVARIAVDCLNVVAQGLQLPGLQRYLVVKVDAREQARWNAVRASLMPSGE